MLNMMLRSDLFALIRRMDVSLGDVVDLGGVYTTKFATDLQAAGSTRAETGFDNFCDGQRNCKLRLPLVRKYTIVELP